MLHFDSDYMEGAHPAIIERLAATNLDQTQRLRHRRACASAPASCIREACANAPRPPCTSWWEARRRTPRWPMRRSSAPWEGIVSADDRPHHRARGGRGGGVRAQDAAAAAARRQAGRGRGARVLRGVLGRREPRAHRGAGRGVYLASYRVRHRCTRSVELEALVAGVPRLRHAAVHGRRAPGLRPGRRGSRCRRCPTSRVCATRSTSAARRWARCAARLWCSRSRGSTNHFFTLMKQAWGAAWRREALPGACSSTMLFEEEDGGLRYEIAHRAATPWRIAQRLAEGFRAKGYDLHHRLAHQPAVRRAGRPDAKARLSRARVVRLLGSSRRTAAPSCASRPVGPRVPEADGRAARRCL